MSNDNERFCQRLDEHHQWPCPYMFKFIVPTEKLDDFKTLFPDEELALRESRTGKYTSVTMETTMCSSQSVMEVYEKAAQIPGIMSL